MLAVNDFCNDEWHLVRLWANNIKILAKLKISIRTHNTKCASLSFEADNV